MLKKILAALTAAAGTVKIKPVAGDGKTVTFGNLFLQLFDFGIFKLEDGPAMRADQMIVVLGRVCRFKAGRAVTEVPLGGDPAFGEQLQRPMHGGVTDIRMLAADFQIEIFRRGVGRRLEKNIQDNLPLPGGFQPLLQKKCPENLL
jgi:hypothetical protein